MNQLLLVWELARKDLRLFLADRRGAVLCFAVPIVLASAFGAIFHRPAGGESIRVSALIVSNDDSAFTRRLVSALRDSDRLSVALCDEVSARRQLAERRVGVVLILPADLDQMTLLRTGTTAGPTVQVLHHPSHALEAGIVEGLFTEIALREAAGELLRPITGTAATNLRMPFEVARACVPDVGTLSINAYAHSFCGMTLQYLLFWGMDSGLLLLRERRQGIWRRLRVAPIHMATLLAGKAFATALVALLQIMVTFAFGRLVFGVSINGSIAGFVALAIAAALLSAATGLLVAAIGGSEGRARSVAILVILTLSMLGGLWLPSFLLPTWVQTATLALPTTWAARGFEGVTWQAMPLAAALRCAGVLLGFSAAFLAVAFWGLRRNEPA